MPQYIRSIARLAAKVRGYDFQLKGAMFEPDTSPGDMMIVMYACDKLPHESWSTDKIVGHYNAIGKALRRAGFKPDKIRRLHFKKP